MRICRLLISLSCLVWLPVSYAAKMAIIIDDFGYRYKTESQILKLPLPVSISILPDSPHGLEMAEKAHQQGREILIHLPMAPIVRQNLEKNTLLPTMQQNEIEQIIHRAMEKVPYAKGINNHMGSAMTVNTAAMQRVMNVLKMSDYYYVDSMTVARSKAYQTALQSGIPALQRHVFLDHVINVNDIRRQFNIAVAVARKQGYVVVIGHPHPETVLILQQEIATLPSDITLVSPSVLLIDKKKTSEMDTSTIVDETNKDVIKGLPNNENSTTKSLLLNNANDKPRNFISPEAPQQHPNELPILTKQQKWQMSLSLFPVPIQHLLSKHEQVMSYLKIEPASDQQNENIYSVSTTS